MLAGTRGDPPLPSAFNTNRRLHEGVSTSTAFVTNIVRSSGPRAVTETLSGVDTAESSEISTGCGLLFATSLSVFVIAEGGSAIGVGPPTIGVGSVPPTPILHSLDHVPASPTKVGVGPLSAFGDVVREGAREERRESDSSSTGPPSRREPCRPIEGCDGVNEGL